MAEEVRGSFEMGIEGPPPAEQTDNSKLFKRGSRRSVAQDGELKERRSSAWRAVEVAALVRSQEDGDEALAEGLTPTEAIMSIVLCACGAGVTVFPKMMADAGIFWAPFLMTVCCLCCSECAQLICQSCELAEASDGGVISSYEALAFAGGGGPFQGLLTFTKNFAFVGFVIIYLQFETESVATFFGNDPPMVMIRFCLVMPVFIGLAMVKDLKQLAQFNMVGIVAVIGQCGCMILGGVLERLKSDPCDTDHYSDPSECRWYSYKPRQSALEVLRGEEAGTIMPVLGKTLATCVFAFAILGTVPSYRAQLADRQAAPEVFRTAMFVILAVYLVVMSFGYLGFGAKAPDNLIVGIAQDEPVIGAFASIGIIINLLISSPIFMVCVIQLAESTGTDALRTPFTPPNIAARATMVVFMTLVSFGLPYALEVIGLVSAVFGCCNNIFFPILFYYAIWKRVGCIPAQNPSYRYVGHVVIVIIGVGTLIFGVQGAMGSLLDKMAGGAKSCVTVSQDGVGPNVPCAFPFIWEGVKHSNCTMFEWDVPWCSTEVTEQRISVEGKWGVCGTQCAAEVCVTDGPAEDAANGGVGPGVQCVFPFRWKGIVHTRCTTFEWDRPWCSTKTQKNGDQIEGNWGNCGLSCPTRPENQTAPDPALEASQTNQNFV